MPRPDRLPLLVPYWFKMLAYLTVCLAVMFEHWWVALAVLAAVIGETIVRRRRRAAG